MRDRPKLQLSRTKDGVLSLSGSVDAHQKKLTNSKFSRTAARIAKKLKSQKIKLSRIGQSIAHVSVKKQKVAQYASIASILILAFGAVNLAKKESTATGAKAANPSSQNGSGDAVLGASTDDQNKSDVLLPGKDDLSVSDIDFKPVLPPGKTLDSYKKKVARKSPDGSKILTFLEVLESTDVQVTEQKLPINFKTDSAGELAKVAKDFQANSVIQIDGQKIYHGYSERSRVQTLIMVRNNLLVFLVSSKKLEDTTWVGYISTLK